MYMDYHTMCSHCGSDLEPTGLVDAQGNLEALCIVNDDHGIHWMLENDGECHA